MKGWFCLRSFPTDEVLLGVLYICMVITHSKRKNQPSKAANPARGQLNKENENFPVLVRA